MTIKMPVCFRIFVWLSIDMRSPPAKISRPSILADSQIALHLYCDSVRAPGTENKDSTSVGPIHKPTFASSIELPATIKDTTVKHN